MRKNKCIRRALALLLSLMTGLLPLTAAWAEEGTGMATPTDLSEPAPEEQAQQSLAEVLATQGHAYVTTADTAKVYGTAAMEEADPVYTITQLGTVLLATAYEPESEHHPVRVWFLVKAGEGMCEPLSGYVAEQALAAIPLTDEEARSMADESSAIASTDAGELLLFAAKGERLSLPTAQSTPMPETEGQNISLPTAQSTPMPETEGQNVSLPTAQATPASEAEEQGADNCTLEGNNLPLEVSDESESNPTNTPSPAPEESAPCLSPSPVPEPDSPTIQVGDFLLVTTSTRAFLGVDETASDEYAGDLNLGMFVREATVQLEAIEQDTLGRTWHKVRYLYGDDFADGRLKWTDTDVIYVLATETRDTESQTLTITDYAFSTVPTSTRRRATAMDGFSLKAAHGAIGTFTPGQSGVYGSSGRDNAYKQIATVAGHGTVYATPHFLDGFTVYCLEHTLPGPGENISSGGQQPKGPYQIVDMDSYLHTPGSSKVIYHESTMHAIAWVLRHTYPFMVLDRSDADNETWSRVAGQFAIREVIKQLEGAQYVRDYWNMDNFYVASNQAPAVYLGYARWLAANGIARSRMTGQITVSNQATSVSDGRYVGTATLATDADLIRIPKTDGTITGYTAGEDENYYYLHSGDTITVTSSSNAFSLEAESVSSDDEEASFLVGVPDAAIQKVLIPQLGVPYKLQSTSLDFELLYGAVTVTKTDAASGAVLSGAVFELLDDADQVIQTLTTDASGAVTFSNLLPGSYTVREKSAPTGYVVSNPTTQAVTVTAGNTVSTAFANEPIRGKIRVSKTDAQTHGPLAGAEFTVTRLSTPEVVVCTITTGLDGIAETDWLPYGKYRIEETKAPAHYANSGFVQEVEVNENGQTYTIEVENESTKGYIQLLKTDALNGVPLQGVQFDVYRETVSDKNLMTTITTDSNGIAQSTSLPKGRYLVRERKPLVGYVANVEALEVEVKPDETSYLSVTNQPIRGKIRIVKRDNLTQALLAGAEFTITRLSEPEVAVCTITTGADGTAETDWLPYGKYRVEETKAPAHYANNGFSQEVDVKENGQTYTIEVENESTKGFIQLLKTNALDGMPLQGVQFDVYRDTISDKNLMTTITTDMNGIAQSTMLPKGRYLVRERKPLVGYVANAEALEVEVKPDETSYLSVTNQPIRGKIRIVKRDNLTQALLAGAEFTVTRLSEPEVVVCTITTGADGTAETDWLPYGRYRVEETKVPAHYANSGFSQEVDVKEPGQTYTIDVENEPTKGTIQVTKTNALDQMPIAGVQFDIYQAGEDGEVLVATMTTQADGVAVSEPLNKGRYIIREHENPEGYVAELVTLEAEVKSDETTALSVANQPIQGRIQIHKTDALTGEALAGAEFTITRVSGLPSHNGNGDGEIVAVMTTDANGVAVSPLLTWGTYRIDETKVPEHYVDNGFSTEVIINEEQKTYIIDAENEPTKGWIRLTKTDLLDQTPIAGVQFDIYQAGEDGEALVATMTTQADGVAVSEPLNKGKYIVREHENPEGYVAELVTLEVEVKSDETTFLSAANQPIQGRIQIHKTDALTREALAGAEFTITRMSGLPSHNGENDGEVVAVITTDANGIAITPLLSWGTYRVEETKVPEHFVDNHYATEVTIDKEDLQTYSIEVENEPTKGWIRLTKMDGLDGHSIAGVTFNIYYNDEYGEGLAGSMTTDENGIATSPALRKGKYLVQEVNEATGYVADLVELDAVVNPDETTSLSVTNQPIQGRIQIHKTDELTREALAGAEFTITRVSGLPSHNGDGDGEVVAVITTDEKGTAITPWLTWGTYRVEETGVPEHFVDNHYATEVTIDKEDLQTYSIEVENEPTKGWIRLTKTDSLDQMPIADVQFDICQAGEDGETLVSTMTTQADGVAVSEPLNKGKYIIREHENPEGYVAELVTLEAEVKSDETTYLSAANQPIQGRIQIHKTDELTKEALAGAEFTISRVSGLPSHNGVGDGEVVTVITTDEKGTAITPWLTWGTYHIEETGVPKHFVDNHYATDVTIDKEDLQTYSIEVENEPTKGWIRLTKTDRQNGNPIAGIQFDIFYNDEYGEGLAATMVTDEQGIALSEPLRKGRYVVREHGATAGYVYEEITLEATVKSDQTTTLEATNQPVQVRLTLFKRDAEEYTGSLTDTPATRGDGVLTGAEFQVRAGEDITDRQGNVLFTKGSVVLESLKTTGEDASITTGELWPGLYEIVEITPPVGYQPSTAPVFVDTRAAATQSAEAVMTYEGIVTNRIKYGAFAIIKVLGNVTNTANPQEAETPEPNAEFAVWLKSAGPYENAREFERDYLVTDQNGYAMTKPLPYGVYTIMQTKGREGYEIKAPMDVNITGTENLVNPPILALSDQPIRYRLRFIKTDAETGKTITLAHASFKLKDADGNCITQKVYYPSEAEIDTFTTDETGSVTLPEAITWGQYFVDEVTAPEGYLIRDESLAVFVGSAGDVPGETYQLDIEIPNTPVKGRILLDKHGLQLTGFEAVTDADGNVYQRPIYEDQYLAGAVFEVHAAEDVIGQDGTVWYRQDELVDTITTTTHGADASKELPLGSYYLVETSAPEGYVFSEERYKADLRFVDDHTAHVETKVAAGNDYLSMEIRVQKEKEIVQTVQEEDGTIRQRLTTAPGEGFVFGLYNNVDFPCPGGILLADTLMATGTTDENGTLTFDGTYPHGDYYIQEISVPEGWKLNPTQFEIKVDAACETVEKNVIRMALPAPVLDELVYTPVTLTKTDITGQQTLPGALMEIRNSQGEIIYFARTDENGHIPDIPVTPGTYTFREVLAPQGYALNEAVMTFSVDEDGNITGDTVIRDDYTRVTLRKQSSSGKPLEGVSFDLYAEDGSQLATALSDANGIVTFERIPYGDFTIMEIQPLPGYLPNLTKVQLSVDGTFLNPTEPLAILQNIPSEVLIKKVDGANEPLSGAEFGLFDEAGRLVQTAISDAEGIARFVQIPYGHYTIRETQAPEGYLISHETTTLTMDDAWCNSAEPLATFVNQLKRIMFIKVDTSGQAVPGIMFGLINAATGDIVETVTSDENGLFVFTQFDYGDWIVREMEAPAGFNKMEDIPLHVGDNWKGPTPIMCVNIPNHYEFVKTDHHGNPMAGVRFTLEDSEGKQLRDLVSGEDGIVHVTDLLPGSYIIREIETLEGFSRTNETIPVVIDEHYIVPETMKQLINYPVLQTGVDFDSTPVTWMGVALILTAASLFVLSQRKRRRPGGPH